jgi:phosphinothricin acetyltransferase
MTIRDARLEDAGELLDIYAWYVRHTAVSFEYEAPTLEAFRERLAATTAKYPWLVAEENGRLLGYACAGTFKDRAAYDWSCETTIYLDRNARGRGIGRAL